MKINNYECAIYKGVPVRITNRGAQLFLVQWDGAPPIDETFIREPSRDGGCKYAKPVILGKDIFTGFASDVKAQYKGYIFDVGWLNGNMAMLLTTDQVAAECAGLDFVDRWDYRKEVLLTEIERMWEERKPSSYGLPMPEGLKEIEEIPLPKKEQ